MAAITTASIALPTEVAQEIMRKAQNTSTIQTLSPASPMLFKDVEHLVGSFPRVRGAVSQDACGAPTVAVVVAQHDFAGHALRPFVVVVESERLLDLRCAL